MNKQQRAKLAAIIADMRNTEEAVTALKEARERFDKALGKLKEAREVVKVAAQDFSARIDEVRSEEAEHLENIPESLRTGDRASEMGSACEAMDGAVSTLDDNCDLLDCEPSDQDGAVDEGDWIGEAAEQLEGIS